MSTDRGDIPNHNHPSDMQCRYPCPGYALRASGGHAPKHNHRPGEFCGEVECPAWRPITQSIEPSMTRVYRGPVSGRVRVERPPIHDRMTKREIIQAFGEFEKGTDEAIRKLSAQITRERESHQETIGTLAREHSEYLARERRETTLMRRSFQEREQRHAEVLARHERALKRALVQVEALTTALVVQAEATTPKDGDDDD